MAIGYDAYSAGGQAENGPRVEYFISKALNIILTLSQYTIRYQ